MKKTIVICDNCKNRLADNAEPTRIGDARLARVVKRDFCDLCISLLLGDGGENGFVPARDVERASESRASISLRRQQAEDLNRIRELLPEAITAWGNGDDKRANDLLRTAAALAAGRRGNGA
jgi:hypothetical protein